MWESICLTLMATAGNNIGKVLQKKGTVILPPLSFKLKVVRAYALNKLWIIGFLMDIVGALLMLKALSQAPVSVVQPVSGCGLAILSVFSHFYLKEVMNALDWVGIALAGVGTIVLLRVVPTLELKLHQMLDCYFFDNSLYMSLSFSLVLANMYCLLAAISDGKGGVGIGGEEQNDSAVSLLRLPWLVFSISILFVLLNAWLHIYKSQRREQELMQSEVVEEIIFGLESGILFGMASVISKMGFVFSEQGFSKILIPICISISICCSATGFVYQTRGLKHGRAIVVSTCAAVASIVTGVLAGMLALGETLPSTRLARLFLLLGWVCIIVGVIFLVTSTRFVSLIGKPFRCLLRSGTERSHGLRRSTSLRAKDPSPSTVIHASTLHHLIPSTAKEKP